MKRKTLIRRKDIDCLFDRTEDYQARIGKIHEKREYDTVYQIVSKFHSMRRAVWNRCEKYGVKKVYPPQTDVLFARNRASVRVKQSFY